MYFSVFTPLTLNTDWLSSPNSTGTKIDPQQVEFETSGPSTSEVQQAKSWPQVFLEIPAFLNKLFLLNWILNSFTSAQIQNDSRVVTLDLNRYKQKQNSTLSI